MNESYENLYNQNPGEVLSLPPMPETAAKPEITFSKSERIAAALMLLGGFLTVRLGVVHPSGLLTTLLYMGIITLQLVFLHKHEKRFRTSDKVFAAVLLLFTCVYTVTANEFIKVLDTIFLIMADCLFLFRMTNQKEAVFRFLPISLTRSVFAMPFAEFGTARAAVTYGTKGKAFWKQAGYILAGLAIALPMTALTAALLIDADDNMSALLGNFLQFEPISAIQMTIHFLIGLLVGSAMFSVLYCSVHRGIIIDSETCEKQIEGYRFIPNTILYAAVTPICVLYLLFFISQIPYFLGGFTGDTAGYSYAEYARQGFFQLCTVCCINFAVIAGMGLFARVSGAVKPLTLKVYSVYLCICSLFLAGTALAKMCMYIDVYGMTQLRVYTSWFMVLLIIGFGAVLVRQFVPKLNLGGIAATAFVIMFGFLCFSRPDALMIRYNADRYLAGTLEEFDTSVMDYTSDDAWAALSSYSPEVQNALGVAGSVEASAWKVQNDFYRGLNLSAWELMSHD